MQLTQAGAFTPLETEKQRLRVKILITYTLLSTRFFLKVKVLGRICLATHRFAYNLQSPTTMKDILRQFES